MSKAGNRFYDLQTAKPYNLGSEVRGQGSGNAAYTLTASDGTAYQLNATGELQEQITSDGTRLIYSDSGILNPDTGETVRFESDKAGRLTQVTAPNGTSVIYNYDKAGNLIGVRAFRETPLPGDSVRYSYGDQGLNLIAGDTGEAVAYFDTPVVKLITKNLGTASSFTGSTTAGTGENLYSFGFRDSEILSTNTGSILLGVDFSGTDELPTVEGLTPVSTQTSTGTSFALYTIDREGLNLLSVNGGDYELQLGIAGDVNNDNAVDGVDSQLVKNALGKSVGEAGYDAKLDVNRDRTIDSKDIQILGSNYGFRYNQAPVVNDSEALTHEDLSVEIPLADLAKDLEGDRVYFKTRNVEHGRVTFTNDGQTAIFKLFADDGYAESDASIVEINVSDAPLTSLDFVERNPKLEVGEQVELQVIADFADQKDVVLPGDYVHWSSESEAVATVSDRGVVTGVSNGTTIFSVERNGLSGVTASRVGQAGFPNTEAELNTAIAEYYGLDVYPDASTLTIGTERQILVGIEGQADSADLSDDETGTRYFVNNPDVISVDEDGLISTLSEGEAEVTVIHGGAESIIPVNVETPNIGATTLDVDGGIVENAEGYQVMIPEGALAEDAEINITSVEQSELNAPLPEKFEVIDAFNLSLGDEDLTIPSQLAIPAPEGLTPGTEVFFMRDGELPDETGTWNPLWLVEESGIVGSDGMIRTSSPPWPGIKKGDDYIITVPKFEYKLGKAYGFVNTLSGTNSIAGVAAQSAGVGIFGFNFGAIFGIPIFYEATLNTVEVITIPKIGALPTTTTAGVSINPKGVPTANVELDVPSLSENDPFAPPVIEQGELNFEEKEKPIVYLTGSNFLVDSNEPNAVGSSFDDLSPFFEYGGESYPGTVIPELSEKLGNNRYQLAIEVPQTVVLGQSSIKLERVQKELNGVEPTGIELTTYLSETGITIKPNDTELTLAAQAFNDQVSVFNAFNPEEILETNGLTSRDLLLAQIPVGTGGNFDDEPRDLVATNDATRAYVSLRGSGKLAVIDLLSLQQVDTNPETKDIIDPIQLPANAAPHAIATSFDDRYAYVGDYRSGSIYIVDIDSRSDTYHRVVEIINIADAANGFHSLAVSSDSKKLFASVPGSSKEDKGKVFVFNIDPEDKPKELKDVPGQFEPNTQKWHDVIGVLEVEKGVEGISATPDPNVMVFTNRFEDFKGFGRIKITSEDPTQFAASVSYTALGLGSTGDYFDVNDARDVVITSDGKYGFVAGANARNFGSGAPSIDGPKSGSNVGIIVDPLTENAKLIAATRPIPNAWTSGISITSDDKYLFASYPGVGGVYAWSVEEMIKTLDNPGEFVIDHLGRGVGSPIFLPSTQKSATKADFSSVPIDNINPDIAIASDLQLTKESYIENKFEFGVPNGSKRAPLTIGANPWSVTNASHRDWLDLSTVGDNNITEDLTPNFEWEFDENPDKVEKVNLYVSVFPDGQGLLLGDTWDELSDLENSSILPGLTTQQKRQLLGVKDPDTGIWDYNPNRILTASWKKNDDGSSNWYFPDGTLIEDPDNLNTITNFTLPNNRTLTAGQTYYWAVEAIEEDGTPSGTKIGQFETSVPEPIVKGDVFTSVTVLTHGFVPPYIQDDVIPPSFFEMADSIANPGTKTEGLVMKYDRTTGYWVPVDQNGKPVKDFPSGRDPSDDPNYLSTLKSYIAPYIAENAPLVLIPDWAEGFESATPDSGFTEAAADAFYASLVQLDLELGGKIGQDTANGFQLYDETTGEIIRKQGSLLNSPLHFVGFSRGAVVNSEIIQRLGTFYPLAGGFTKAKNGDRIGGDLQMTTLDPHDFNQPGLNLPIIGNFSDFYEPKVQVWDNVTFADNYFQTVPDLNGNTLTPAGRDIPNVPNTESPDDANAPKGIDNPTTGYPLNPELGTLLGVPNHSVRLGANKNDADNYENSRAGFTKELKDTNPLAFFFDGTGAVHGQVNSWYTGTADFDLTEFPDQIYRRRGDGYYEHLFDSDFYSLRRDPRFNPWYTADFLDKNDPEAFALGEANAPWEGIGTGWFYSALGGGKDKRPESTTARVPVEFDNTYDTRMRGDFAVPTLFNGNFDAVTKPDSRPLFNTVPGWSNHFNDEEGDLKDLTTDKLVEWSKIPNLDTYREQVGYDPKQPNYALKLDGGDKITHNNFAVPDWGTLRFDVHVPNINGGQLQVTLQASDGSTAGVSTAIFLEPAITSALEYEGNTRKIGYGTQGFETFTLDIPENLRGKTATLSFQLDSGNPIYLDDVFFQSKDLMLGLPTLNEQTPRTDLSFADNFLIEKPQYSLSYNQDKKGPNWVSWNANKSWFGNISRIGEEEAQLDPDYPYGKFDYPWISDPTLPDGLTTTIPTDYSADPNYDRGHLSPSEQRNRSVKDMLSTFLTTNLLPQYFRVNEAGGAWRRLEIFNKQIAERGWNLYITAGGAGTIPNSPLEKVHGINTPESIWQVIVALKPGERIEDIDIDTPIIAVNIPNDRPVPIPDDPDSPDPTQWYTWITTINEIEASTGLDLLSNLPDELEKQIEQTSYTGSVFPTGFPIIPFSGSLLAEELNSPVPAIGESGITQNRISDSGVINSSWKTDRGFTQVNTSQVSSNEVRFTPKLSSFHTGISQVGTTQSTILETSPSKISSSEVGIIQSTTLENSTTQISSNEVGSIPFGFPQIGIAKIDPTQVTITEIGSIQIDSTKIPFTTSVSPEQFFFIHNSTPKIINVLNNSATKIWSDLLQSETQLDIDFQITDLPSGQLAEATITDFDNSGKPNAGTILIDRDANGVGWFIDETPLDNSEFTAQDTDSYLLAATESEADGKYDLLTTVLHELSHLYGFIDGYAGFDENVETENGTTKFIGDDFTATLDGEHLDKSVHPYDLLNTHLASGMRKLPSKLDVEILQALLKAEGSPKGLASASGQKAEGLDAALTSDPLLAINNGDFENSDTTTDSFTWDTRGASGIENGQAVLTEDSPFLSNFTQTFTVPEDAKTIQFKLIDTQLGASELAPPDAFEVALLDANTNESLVTDSGLTETDSLLNIQNDGTAYFSDQVRIGGATSGDIIGLDRSRTVTVDISDLTPGTEATLYFDLLGFGDVDSRVVIDDVRLSDQNLLPPTAVDDTATTTQGQSTIIDILANDTDDDGAIATDSIQIATEPTNGTVTVNDDGTVSYTPGDRFVGTDSFTYTVQDNDAQSSEPAEVKVTVKNAAPEITEIQIPDNVTEGNEVTIRAIATDAGNDELTYTWEFDDDTTVEGQSVNRTYANNGTYTGSVTVTDTFGGSDTQAFEVVVANAAPVVDAGEDKTVDEGSSVAFTGSFTDAGINDTHTVTWDFGDGSDRLSINNEQLSIEHTYTDDGTYTASFTVTDSDGAVSSDELTVTVNNVAPTITNLTGDTSVKEGDTVNFSATATDPGSDTITYIWDFGDGSETVKGAEASHVFRDNGIYNVTLTARDEDGGETAQTLEVTVENIAPTFTEINGKTTVNEGEVVDYSATATDPGDDELTYTWNFGGQESEVRGQEVNYSFPNNGTYTGSVTVNDDDGAATISNLSITVNNVAPTLTTDTAKTGNEGEALSFEATFDDAGNDDLTVTWDFGDGSDAITTEYPAESTPNSETQSHVYTADGTYKATVTVTDSDGAVTESTIDVAIANLTPVIESLTGDTEINEGDVASFNAIASDPGADQLTYTWNFGDDSDTVTGTDVTHIFSDNGDYTVTLTVTDEEGGETAQTLDVRVNNVAPEISSIDGETNVDEGEEVTYRAIASDAGDDELTYTWNFGDGSDVTTGENVNHVFAQDGIYDATLIVEDDDGAKTTQNIEITVNNVAPTVETESTKTGDEGQIVQFTATVADPGDDELTVTWDFGDGSDTIMGENVLKDTASHIEHIFVDNGLYQASVTVTDDDGASVTQSLTITVNNVAPIIDPWLDETATEGDTVELAASFSDRGVLDTHTIAWDFGDGNTTSDTLTPSHVYTDDGVYEVTLTVTDNDGASTSSSINVTVNNAAPAITSLTGDTKVNEGDPANFSIAATDPGDDELSYTWDFGDGETATGTDVAHIFSQNGNYTVTATVTDDDGASTNSTKL